MCIFGKEALVGDGNKRRLFMSYTAAGKIYTIPDRCVYFTKRWPLLTAIGMLVMLFELSAQPAFAGIGLGIAPKYPTTVVVGGTGVPVAISIQNTSSAPQNVGPVTLSNIRHTPSCG